MGLSGGLEERKDEAKHVELLLGKLRRHTKAGATRNYVAVLQLTPCMRLLKLGISWKTVHEPSLLPRIQS